MASERCAAAVLLLLVETIMIGDELEVVVGDEDVGFRAVPMKST